MGTKTHLNGVNEVLINTRWVDSANLLASLTDTGIQGTIDQCTQAWNQSIQELFRQAGRPMPDGSNTGTITLATGTREYAYPTGFLSIIWPLINETDGFFIREYRGGFEQMRMDQLQPSNWKGRPHLATLNPATNKLRMDREPTVNENGEVYTMLFKKTVLLSVAADTMPFDDDVFNAMVPSVAEVLRSTKNADPDFAIAGVNFSRAASYLGKNPNSPKW